MTFHLTDDILFEMASPRFANLSAVLVFVIWLYGTLVLAERRAGYIIILLGSLLGIGWKSKLVFGRNLLGMIDDQDFQ
jgi:hypothetical protein